MTLKLRPDEVAAWDRYMAAMLPQICRESSTELKNARIAEIASRMADAAIMERRQRVAVQAWECGEPLNCLSLHPGGLGQCDLKNGHAGPHKRNAPGTEPFTWNDDDAAIADDEGRKE